MTDLVHRQLRVFIAIPIPEEIKAQMATVQTRLRQVWDCPGMRWTGREQFHLTLKFLGAIDQPCLEPLTQAVQAACAGFAPLTLSAEKLGFFPGQGTPRVLWISVNDSEQRLGNLQQEIERRTRPFTNEAPEGPFTGHVTLARAKRLSRPEAKQLKEAVAPISDQAIGNWVSGEVMVMRSELTAEGARHECVARARLGKMEEWKNGRME